MKKVTLYIINTNNLDVSSLPLLTNDDHISLSRYKDERTRKEKTASLYLKKKYIGDYFISEKGKPLSKDKYFNISHAYGYVLLAISDTDIGVDIEGNRKVEDELKRYIASDEEYDLMVDDQIFYKVWTSKESLLKCVGTGLVSDLKGVPSLPFNGLKIYQGNKYYSKCIDYKGLIISLTLKTDEDFFINIIEE